MLQEFGYIISSNHQSTISMNAVYDHFDILSYPKTSIVGVAHFVHFPTPLIQEGDSKVEVQHAVNQQMSKVCVAYIEDMLNLTAYRSNSYSLDTILILQIYKCSARIIGIKISKYSIVYGNALESNIVNMPTKMCSVYAMHMTMSS